VLWVDATDSLDLITNGTFEPAESALCRTLLRPGDRVLDIGANLGYYTTLFAERVRPSGHVDAIEPDPHSFSLLHANTRGLQADGLVRLHAVALSDETRPTRLYMSKDNAGMHRLYESVCCDRDGIEVTACRGDDLTLAPLDLIKIDVEGFEPRVLRGLSRSLAASPDVKILCEYSPMAIMEAGDDPGQWLRWMRERGFCVLAYDGNGWAELDWVDLQRQAAKILGVDMDNLIAGLQDADNAQIFAAASAAAISHGYTRPLVENLLFARHR
jgi:FkbM family methyltransferase